jgi:mannonate dehydratase
MIELTRRDCIQGTLAALAGAGAGPALPALTAVPNTDKSGIKLAEVFGSAQSPDVKLAKQIGINYAITGGGLNRVRREQYVETLQKLKDGFTEAGMTIAGVESDPVSSQKIKLGLEGRDEEIENYKWAIEALSKVGIKLICYNFIAGLGVVRTRLDLPERGGALTTQFDLAEADKQGLSQWGEVSEEKMWDNITYFLKAVMPVADKFGVQMALHPDDPPVPRLRGIARIATSARNYRRIMDIVPSPVNGVTFCQANFKLMGEDIYSLAKEWCSKKKIFFVHFRDVVGTREKFRETFHDNGPTDMPRMLRIYSESGFNAPMRPDHAPTIGGEANDRPGYAMGGKVLAFGYMKGIMAALKLPYE